jgi:hypothetical protein
MHRQALSRVPLSSDECDCYVPITGKTVHRGCFGKALKPLVELKCGDFVAIKAACAVAPRKKIRKSLRRNRALQ